MKTLKKERSIEIQETVFSEAEKLIYGDREKTYGDPSKNLSRIAELWDQYQQKNLREAIRLALMMLGYDGHTPEELRVLTNRKDVRLNTSVTDVCHMMQLLKWARDENTPKRDNVVDDLGYGGLVHRCRNSQETVIPDFEDVVNAVSLSPKPSRKSQRKR